MQPIFCRFCWRNSHMAKQPRKAHSGMAVTFKHKRHASIVNDYQAKQTSNASPPPDALVISTSRQPDVLPATPPETQTEHLDGLPDYLLPNFQIEDGPLKSPASTYEEEDLPKDLVSLTDWRLRAKSQTGLPLPWLQKRVSGSIKIMRQDENRHGLNSLRKWSANHLRLIVTFITQINEVH
jgi:hypothetical protein